MAVTYGFFDSVNGDRKYNAETMSDFYTGICSQGVFQSVDSGMAVTAGTGLSVSVASGRAIVQEHWIKNDSALTLTITEASTTYARIDAVVIRFSESNRNITIAVKDGTPSASPSAPAMTRTGGVYELALAYVNVAANASSVTVTDKRSDTSVCGWAAVAQAIDGTYEAMIDDMKTGFDGVVYQSPGAAVRGCDELVENELFASMNSSIISNFFEANPIYASGSHTNIINLSSNQESDYSSALKYSPFGLKSKITTANQNYWFAPSFVSGSKYRIYANYHGETNQYGISNIRLYRGDTLLKQFNTVGDSNESYEFTSDGTEKFKIYISNPTTFEVYSLIGIKVATTFSTDFSSMLSSVIKNPLQYGGHVTTANYSTLLPDLNDAPVNTYYTVFTNSTSILPANCPITTLWPYIVETYGTNGYVVFQKFTILTNSSSLYSGQLMGTTWYRALTGTPGSRAVFYPWKSAEDILATHIKAIENEVRPVVTVDKNATPNESNLLYNNFYKAMKYAYNNNCDVNVKAGNYDLVAEYIAVEGQSAYDAIANVWKGTPIGHGMKVKCAAEAYFTMKNTSSTSANYLTIGQWLSPILPLDGGFRLEGWNCDAKNCRYVIHDGGYNNSDVFCNHEIVNCQMKLDNTDFEGQPGLQTYRQCIGGGLLSGGVHVIVKDCIFASENVPDNAGIVSYHNISDTTEGATSYCTYEVSGCYCKMGTIRCTYHGTETPVSPFKVHDNFIRSNPIIGAEVPATDTTVNMELFAWNNTVQASA